MKKTEFGKKLWMPALKKSFKKLRKRFKRKMVRGRKYWMVSIKSMSCNKKQNVSGKNCWISSNNTLYQNSTYFKILSN